MLIFLIGCSHWFLFFNLGRLSFRPYDWPKEFKYYSTLQQAIQQRRIPYYVSESFQGTNRFLAIPEVVVSPQIILLSFMNVNSFLIVQFMILYAFGFLGCLLIKKRYQLSLFSFGILYLLFNFNGHIISHVAVGHSMWGGYFFLPCALLFIFKLVEGDFSILTMFKLAFVLFLIILQGSFHIYIWCLLFFLILGGTHRKYAKPLLVAICVSLLLSAFRLLPAAVTFSGKRQIFITGYQTVQMLLDSLVSIRSHTYQMGGHLGAGYFAPGWWEYDVYLSVLGFLFILFGLYMHFIKERDNQYQDLNTPIIGQTILSLGPFYALIAFLPLPFVSSERMSSRFLIIPLLTLVILSSIYLQKIINSHELSKNPKLTFAALVGLIQMSYEFAVHSLTWSLRTIEKLFQEKVVDLRIPAILTGREIESAYALSFRIGIALSVITLITVFCLTCLSQFSRRQV